MLVNQEKCIGCGQCVPFCPAKAIVIEDKKAHIDQGLCYECGVCTIVGSCKFDALYYPEITGPRANRYYYNNVLTKHPVTGMTGRGTPEMKTNELTNRFKRGEAGFGIEIGRPDVGATFRDVEKVAMALARIGVKFEPGAPTTLQMVDTDTGKLDDAILDERIICSIIEFTVPTTKLAETLKTLEEVAQKIDTVFSVDLVTRAEEDGSLPNVEIAKALGYEVRPNGKATLGLGRPNPEQVKEGR